MGLSIVVALLLCSLNGILSDDAADVTVIIKGTSTIAETNENFVCATIDWWPPEKCNYNQCPWGESSVLNLDLTHPFVANAIKAFNPLRIRVGGSLQDQVVYGMPNLGHPCVPFSKTGGGLFGFSQGCLSMKRWDELNDLFLKTGNALLRRMVDVAVAVVSKLRARVAPGADTYALLIAVSCCRGDFADAAKLWNAAPAAGIEPGADAHNAMILAMLKSNRFEDAVAMLKSMRARRPRNGSHGFVKTYKWSNTIGAFIDIEAYSYIVYLGSHSHGDDATLEDFDRATDSRHELLASFVGSREKAKDSMIYSYTKAINGFAVHLEEEDAQAIANHPEVVTVFENKFKKLHTTHSWAFVNLQANDGKIPRESLFEKAKFGEDTIIANIDSGVWPESKSFSDEGYGPVPSRWRGFCENNTKEQVPCNRFTM